MKDKINEIRETLHNELESKKINHQEIINISENLDKLIIEYYEEEKKIEKD